MPSYSYEALDRSGRTVRGVIEAAGEDVIVNRLRGIGHYPVRVVQHRQKIGEIDLLALPGFKAIFHRVKTKHLTTFTRQLATLIAAGLPLTRSLAVLQEQAESAMLKDKIGDMKQAIEGGASLSDALARQGGVFDNLYVNMTRAGELGGVLDTVLLRLADFMEKRQAIVAKVRAALTYPLAVMTLATAIVGVILIWIMPRFETIFAELGQPLPWLTQQLVHASYVLTNFFPYVLLGLFTFALIVRQISRTRHGKYVLDRIKLKLPVFGDLLRKSAIVRFAGTLSTLISAGVPILQAIDIVRDTSGNEVVSRAMEKVYRSVKNGDTIHQPLESTKVFPPLVIHMVAVGEETGAIDQLLTKVAEAYENEVENTVNVLTSLLEPILMVFLGVVIGTVVIALYLPLIYLPTHIPQQ